MFLGYARMLPTHLQDVRADDVIMTYKAIIPVAIVQCCTTSHTQAWLVGAMTR
jgi:hypothetical protein